MVAYNNKKCTYLGVFNKRDASSDSRNDHLVTYKHDDLTTNASAVHEVHRSTLKARGGITDTTN